MKKRFSGMLAVLLCMTMILTVTSTTVFAQDGTAQVQSGLPALTVNTSKVAFAGREWWVIGNGTEGVYPQTDHITLLAADMEEGYYNVPFRKGLRGYEHINPDGSYPEIEGYHLHEPNSIGFRYYYAVNPSEYDAWSTPNEYAGSTLQQKMEEIAQSLSSNYSGEYELITPRNFAGGGTIDSFDTLSEDDTAGPAVDNQKLWALSLNEVKQLPSIENLLTYKWNSTETCWLLRSPVPTAEHSSGDNDYSDRVLWTGSGIQNIQTQCFLDMDSTKNTPSVRPALSLDVSSVLFTSAADGNGKSSAAACGNLVAAGQPAGTVKFTVQDSSMNLTVPDKSARNVAEGEELSIAYKDATTGSNQYISCILKDSTTGEIKYYGKLAETFEAAGSSGTVNIPLEGIPVGSYTLCLFSEQCNGDNVTDFASAFQEISLTVTLPRETMPQATFTAAGDNGGTLSNIELGMKYSTDGGASWKDITDTTMELTDVTEANDVKVYKPGNGSTTSDSAVQTIDITQAAQPTVSGVDCTTTEQNNGKITDVDSTMEYKLSTASEWTGITGTEVTGLSNGTYDVRVKASGTTLASDAATVTIGEHTCVAQEGWNSDETNHWNTCECGEKLNEAAHTFEWVTDKEATATEAGSKHEECTVCGYKKAAVEIPATGTTEDPSEPPTDTDKPSGDQTGDTTSPETGDDSNIALWVAVMLAVGAALTGTVLYGRKRKYSR